MHLKTLDSSFANNYQCTYISSALLQILSALLIICRYIIECYIFKCIVITTKVVLHFLKFSLVSNPSSSQISLHMLITTHFPLGDCLSNLLISPLICCNPFKSQLSFTHIARSAVKINLVEPYLIQNIDGRHKLMISFNPPSPLLSKFYFSFFFGKQLSFLSLLQQGPNQHEIIFHACMKVGVSSKLINHYQVLLIN